MKRFVDLGTQLLGDHEEPSYHKEFAFFCTVTGQFEVIAGESTWGDSDDFEDMRKMKGVDGALIDRLLLLIPDNWPNN